MAQVELNIGGHHYTVVCRAGGEDHLRALGQRVDAKIGEARAAIGTAGQVRQLLFAALLLADEVAAVGQPPIADAELPNALAALATRIEALADGLEDAASSA